MKYLSLFSGIGGFELGIGPKHECVGFSEIDKYAVQIYQKHFPEHKNWGDITKINENELPEFELLVGGFPPIFPLLTLDPAFFAFTSLFFTFFTLTLAFVLTLLLFTNSLLTASFLISCTFIVLSRHFASFRKKIGSCNVQVYLCQYYTINNYFVNKNPPATHLGATRGGEREVRPHQGQTSLQHQIEMVHL